MRFTVVLSALLCLLFCSQAKAQDAPKGRIYGQIVDTISNNVNRATISLVKASDTLDVKRTLSDSAGHFNFPNLDLTTYIIQVSFQGYDVVNKYVSINDQRPDLDVGEIALQQTLNELGTVVVTAVVPITFKGDTMELNADAYATQPNATVEDLLKKLPGTEVDKNGNITNQGEAVPRVFVDGKRFFSGDPTMATQNLPKDVVDKIQIFDGKSDQAEFTGFDDGNTIKTINIVTKKDKRHGVFGKSSAAIGNDDPEFKNGLYNLNGRYFKMDGDRRFGFMGNFNNVNIGSTNNTGLNKRLRAGVTYQDQLGPKTDISTSYSYNNGHNVNQSKSFNQNLFSLDTSQLTNNSNYGINNNQGHNFEFNLETKFDSANQLRIRPNISYNTSNSSSNSTNAIDQLIGTDTTHLSSSQRSNTSSSNSYNASLGTTYRHAFHKKGRSISLDLQLSANRNKSQGRTLSNIYSYLEDQDSVTNQRYYSLNETRSIATTLAYTEPLAEHHLLQLEYSNSYRRTTSERNTYNYDSLTGGYTTANDLLTNNYENTYLSNRATLGYMYDDGALHINAGTGVQFGKMNSDNLSKNIHLAQNYVNMYPTASVSYKFEGNRRLRFTYRGRTSQPSVNDLQPVVDNSNPLHIRSGNPDLDQEFNHNFNLRFNNFNRETNQSFNVTLDGNITQHNIVSAKFRLPNGGDSTVPVNMNGFYSVGANINWSFPINSPKSNLDLSTNIRNQRRGSLIDGKPNFTTTTTLRQRIGWTTNLTEDVDINFSTDPGYNITSYTISRGSQGNYYSQSISFDGTWFTKSGWKVMSDFDYRFYAGLPAGQNTAIPIWNAGFAKAIFKDQSGEIKLSVNDILNQNKGLDFTRTDNVISRFDR